MSDPTPWLTYLIKLEKEHFHEIDGPESNPKILEWAEKVGFDGMNDDSTTPWCGIGMAGIFYDIGMKDEIPPSPALAISWMQFGVPCEPKIGAIAVFPRPGGNHVTCIKEIRGEEWLCIGCNQSNAITTTRFYASQARGTRWPKGVKMETKISPAKGRYSDLLQRSQVKPEWQAFVDRTANRIIANKDKYKEVEKATGVPWAFIGCLHYRESDLDFKTHLHNGDPLTDRTRHEPSGRPINGEPPFEWTESAIDALEYEKFVGLGDWTLENICERAEKYNGLGYRNRGINSPYLWSGTNNYERGKFVSDGAFSASTIDKQLGVIPLYIRTMDLAHEKAIIKGSRKLNILSNVKTAIQGLIALIGSIFTLDTWGILKDWFTLANGVIDAKMLVSLFLTGLLVWLLVHWISGLILEDAKAGTYIPSGMVNTEVEEPSNGPDNTGTNISTNN